jgi:hypothetical protein
MSSQISAWLNQETPDDLAQSKDNVNVHGMKSNHRRPTNLVLAIFSIVLAACAFHSRCAPKAVGTWYKGNLHTHTTNSDGDTPPADVVRWYRDHGYNFLSITDHNFITPVEEFRPLFSDTFILISGNEISDTCEDKPVHLVALGIFDAGVQPTGGENISACLQNNVDAIRAAGAVPVLAHPNFHWAFGASELTAVQNCVLFEVLNAHPAVNNAGDNEHPSTEAMWDAALSAGKKIYGIGSDDMHALATYPGKSWVMARSRELTPGAVLEALEDGDFYVSTGVGLEDIRRSRKGLRIRIKKEEGFTYRTEFIGPLGTILAESASLKPVFRRRNGVTYVRARVIASDGRLAFTQPVFFDD